ncbi:hypothetical protein GCM10027436_02470 [Actinophytocola sediminis]
MPAGAVAVDRTTRFGNPFSVADAVEAGYENPQRAVVSHFRAWVRGSGDYPDAFQVKGRLLSRKWIREHLGDLAGKDVACWCGPDDPCHADVLLELANGGAS